MHVSHVAEDGRIEEVADHLREVAEMAAEFARPFGAESWAYAAGMAHDIGKYSTEFQNRILCDGHKVDHSTAGAALLDQLGLKLLAYCVAGHHAGLPDGGTTQMSKTVRLCAVDCCGHNTVASPIAPPMRAKSSLTFRKALPFCLFLAIGRTEPIRFRF